MNIDSVLYEGYKPIVGGCYACPPKSDNVSGSTFFREGWLPSEVTDRDPFVGFRVYMEKIDASSTI